MALTKPEAQPHFPSFELQRPPARSGRRSEHPVHNAENLSMVDSGSFYFGNAAVDQVRNTGWFLGQFIQAELGLRHQTDVELKWGIHPDGERRAHAWANGNGTTVSILIRGSLRVTFHVGARPQVVHLEKHGDYIIFGPQIVHSWEAIGDTLVLSIRFPSVEVGEPAKPTRRKADLATAHHARSRKTSSTGRPRGASVRSPQR
jgi:hypothetical protein